MSYLAVAKRIAKEAGDMIKKHLNDNLVIEEKGSGHDIVTEIDRASEQLIRKRITEYFPDHGILGEEESYENKQFHEQKIIDLKNSPFLWVVDPIDGTNNFVQKIPGFVVSIALICNGNLTIGVIYDPLRDEMFWAEKGQGAYMNGKGITVSATGTLLESVVGTSFSSDVSVRKRTIKSLDIIISKCRTARILGSAALNLAYVASGRLTAFWHYQLNVWDIAAGILIIQESGGLVTTTCGGSHELSNKTILASNKTIHESMVFELNS